MRFVTSSGQIVPLLGSFAPKLSDVARHLSCICRFNGAGGFYSVAQHSVLVSHLVPHKYAFQGLMHDAHEAYSHDLATSHKEVLDEAWHDLERRLAGQVRRYFGLPLSLSPAVKAADHKALQIEIANLFSQKALASWLRLGYEPDYSQNLTAWSPDVARQKFLERFKEVGPNIPA